MSTYDPAPEQPPVEDQPDAAPFDPAPDGEPAAGAGSGTASDGVVEQAADTERAQPDDAAPLP